MTQIFPHWYNLAAGRVMATRLETRIKKLEEKLARENRGQLATVSEAAEIIGVSNRRIRAFIKPECNCVIRLRRRKGKKDDSDIEIKPDANCLYCKGTGHTQPRLVASKLPDGQYIIHLSELYNFARVKRAVGRPPEKNDKLAWMTQQ